MRCFSSNDRPANGMRLQHEHPHRCGGIEADSRWHGHNTVVSTSYSYLTSIALLHKTQLQQRCARTHCVGVRARARNKEKARCLFFGARTQIPGHNGRNWASTHFGRGVFCSSFAPSLLSYFPKRIPSKKSKRDGTMRSLPPHFLKLGPQVEGSTKFAAPHT